MGKECNGLVRKSITLSLSINASSVFLFLLFLPPKLVLCTSRTYRNTFTQSYTLQVQWVLEAVFARLGVRHESRNFGNGGLGTIQHGLAAASVFGPDVDMLMWDSGMTEGEEHAKEVIFIQAALSGSKVPVYWSLAGNAAKLLHLKADVDVGYFGDGIEAMPLGESLEEIGKMPWAVQYVHCSDEMHQICRENEYNAECWVERDDFSPPKTQVKMGGRANWHPGNRIHQIRGRIIASQILQALKDALTDWKEAPNYELPDSAWHVTAMYDNVRNKLKALGPEDGSCQSGLAAFDMEWTCKYPAKVRSILEKTGVHAQLSFNYSSSVFSQFSGPNGVYSPCISIHSQSQVNYARGAKERDQ